MLHRDNIEATIDELLHDPIAELLRRRDRVSLEAVRACIEEARLRLRWCPVAELAPVAH